MTAPFAWAKAAMPHMRRGGGGLVVNVSSVAGRREKPEPSDPRESLDPAVGADLIAWMAMAPGQSVQNEVTMKPLLEGGWP